MLFDSLFKVDDTPADRQIGSGVFVRYDEGDLDKLVHVLRFLAQHKEDAGQADADLPAIVVGGAVTALHEALTKSEEAAERDQDIAVPIVIFFTNERQLIFRAYLDHLRNTAETSDEAVKQVLALYTEAEQKYFPRKEFTH